MAKGIYAIMVKLFSNRLKLTHREEEGMVQVLLFITMVYTECWDEATFAAHAPENDRDFIQDTADYRDQNVADPATC